jgi:crotonobetaine/carnitine-CoA ligase
MASTHMHPLHEPGQEPGQEDLLRLLEADHRTAVEALDHNVEQRPAHLALRYGDTLIDFTYGEFGRLTDSIAGNLASMGAQPGDCVSVLSTDPRIGIETMYGIWKAGCVYAPVNYQFSGDLLLHQLGSAGAQILIVDSALRPRVDAITDRLEPAPILVLVDGGEEPGNGVRTYAELTRQAARPDVALEPEMPANIIYTSGTTGPSKAVVQSHRWVNAYTWVGRHMLDVDDVIYTDLPMYHVAAAHWNVARALWVGATVSVWERFSASQFWDRVNVHGCTTTVLLNVMIPRLLGASPRAGDRDNTLNKVHMQPLPPDHGDFARRFGIDIVTSGFGQSESGSLLISIIRELEGGADTPVRRARGLPVDEITARYGAFGFPVLSGDSAIPAGVMGRPNPFVEISVLDAKGDCCAPGVVGEMCVRPRLPGVIFDEYLGQPEATRESMRFGWFHTGDAVVEREDGVLAYVDRLGDRLRVNGENISSLELEQLLSKGPGVGLVSVLAIRNVESGEDDIVAFVEWDDEASRDLDVLRAYAQSELPKFMRPHHYVVLDEIPRTPTNKVEKYKLKAALLAEREVGAGPGS